jgi:hypothetical protein
MANILFHNPLSGAGQREHRREPTRTPHAQKKHQNTGDVLCVCATVNNMSFGELVPRQAGSRIFPAHPGGCLAQPGTRFRRRKAVKLQAAVWGQLALGQSPRRRRQHLEHKPVTLQPPVSPLPRRDSTAARSVTRHQLESGTCGCLGYAEMLQNLHVQLRLKQRDVEDACHSCLGSAFVRPWCAG